MKPRNPQQQQKAQRRNDHYLFLMFLVTIYASLFLVSINGGSTTPELMESNKDSIGPIADTLAADAADGTIQEHEHRHLKKEFGGRSEYSKYSCEDIFRHPLDAASQCTFATTCNDGDGILFGNFIFCSRLNQDQGTESKEKAMSHTLLLWLICTPLALLLILLFRILGSTAEEFFSPGLEMLSLRLGLPERFAGVTLLALGNGAPDVASVVSAIRNDHKHGYLLALGELTGTCMVGSTVIVGAVAFVSPQPVPCRGSLIRDIIMFIITMILVFTAFQAGSINPHQIRSFVGLYVAYVLIVLSADIYHRKVVTPTDTSTTGQPQKQKTNHLNGGDGDDKAVNTNTSESTPLVSGSTSTTNNVANNDNDEAPSSSRSLIQQAMRLFTNYNDEDDDSEEDSHEGETVEQKEEAKLEEQGLKSLQPPPLSQRHSRQTSSGWGERDDTGHEPLMVFHPHHGGMVNLKHLESSGSEHGNRSFRTDNDDIEDGNFHHHDHHWLEVQFELREYFNSFFHSIYYSNDYNWMEKLLMTLELPVSFLRMLSIPVPCDGYYCRPLLALSVALSPYWGCYYLYDQFDVNVLEQSTTAVFVAVVAIPLAIGFLVLRFAPMGSIPPRPLAAVPLTLIGFVVSATWLDLIADKLVRLLTFFAIICHIPSTIMGLTILAWGNSSQDLIANITVARKDLSIMAITASFAGPVFNILVGLGIGFAILNTTGESVPVHLDNPLRIGFLFSVLNGILVIVSGVCFGKGVIPQKYGYVAMVVYFVYVLVSITI